MINYDTFLFLENGTSAAWNAIPFLEFPAFQTVVLNAMEDCRLESFFAIPIQDKTFKLIVVLGCSERHGFLLLQTEVQEQYPSFTAHFAAFNRFEREIYEEHNLLPENHPWLKPLRFSHDAPGVTNYFSMSGEPVHEVAVGPVHAGVIEPGHFRFECMGEDVYSLEISLGYQHRGAEKLLSNGPDRRTGNLLETIAGDSSIAYALNYSQIVESLSNLAPEAGAVKIRQLALELERCANHIGDLGALAGDVAFLPTASFCGRIRGEYLNMTAELCGNRFGRNLLVPGGVRYTLEPELARKLLKWLEKVSKELWNALELMFNSPTVLDRFENTGSVSGETARMLGMVGMAARACGLKCDARKDFPGQNVEYALPSWSNGNVGDVASRARIRYQELKKSHNFILKTLTGFAEGEFSAPIPSNGKVPRLQAEKIAVSVTEAWRGELCHVAITNREGKFSLYKIVDPSFHNWEGLAMALRGEQISNFPICNKSFNLSYCGHDL